METSTRTRILEAAAALAQENDSIQGVTISLDSVARRAGVTKPGLMYHFPNKEALMLGLVDRASLRWSELLREWTGHEPEQLSAFDRFRAYASVAARADVSRADYWIFSDALYHPTLAEAWHEHLDAWFDLGDLGPHARSLLTAARFCSDGAWMSEATGVFPAEDLAAICEHAFGLIAAAERAEAESTEPERTGGDAPDPARKEGAS